MRVAVPRETLPGEARVALVPASLTAWDADVTVETRAGDAAGFADAAYRAVGAAIASDATSAFAESDVVVKVQPPSPDEAAMLRDGSTLISYLYPATHAESLRALARRHVTALALERMPRISRAQAMDTLSSQANLAGYKAALVAADALPRIVPLMMTAAGTVAPARALVIGAGVAGLQAIATLRRLGAVVEAYDVRPTVKEEVESLGARFVELAIPVQDAQTSGGYARAQTEDVYRRQTELLAERFADADMVITTALVPGQRAPALVSEKAVAGMRAGSVIVDVAAEQGGNCELTEAGRVVQRHGVWIHGPLNLPATLAPQASELFSRNATAYASAITKDGALALDKGDPLVQGPLVLDHGGPVGADIKTLLGALTA